MRKIELVPAEPLRLSIDEGRDAAKAAFFKAKAAQMALVSRLGLTERLHDPGAVTYFKLKGMHRQAQEQADRAQEVADLLEQSMMAMEVAAATATQPEGGAS